MSDRHVVPDVTQTFYDSMASQYDKFYQDWNTTAKEEAVFLDGIFRKRGFDRSARILDVECDPDGALEIATRSRGTPRLANRLLKRVRDFAVVLNDGVIDRATADRALNRMEIDHLGLDLVDRRILEAMIRHYNGGPVGLDTLAAVTGEEAITIEDVYEPYLMQLGFINRTPRGRVVLPAAYAHLGIANPNGQTCF